MSADWTSADIPDQTARVAVVTGSNTGVGYEIAAALAGTGAHVVLAVRNLEKGDAARTRILETSPRAAADVHKRDLASLASVRESAKALRAAHDRVDLLI